MSDMAVCLIMTTFLAGPLVDLAPWIRRPQHHLRVDATWQTAIVLLPIPLTLFLSECYLVRRSGTHRLRALIALLLVPSFTIFAFAIRWAPGHAPLSIVSTMSGIFLAARSAEFGILSIPLRRTRELPEAQRWSGLTLAAAYDGLVDAIDLSMNLRGIGFEFGQGTGLKLSPDNRPSRPQYLWLRQTVIYHLIPSYLVFDTLNNFLLRYRPVRDIHDGRLVMDQLNLIESIAIKALSAILVATAITFIYTCCSVFAVVILGSLAQRWPPLFGKPWFSTSLHGFWAVDWHQILRHTFLITGGYPLGSLIGKYGLVLGAFVSSGFFHSLMLLGVNDIAHFDWPVFRFFAVQAAGVACEDGFKRLSGKRVGGLLGWIWTITFLLTTGSSTCNIWVQQGFLSARLFPQTLSLADKLFTSS